MKKIIYTAIATAVLILGFFAFSRTYNDVVGEITIIVVDEIGDTISADIYEIEFTESDSLFSILDENFEVGCADSSYNMTTECEPLLYGSRVILKIDSLETDWTNSYIGIYENGEYSNLGIDSISLNDGDIFRFVYTLIGDDE
jgi:hypothetical protein